MAKIQTRFRNAHQTSYLAREIAQSMHRGTAIEAKIETALNHLRETTDVKSLKKIDQNTIQTFVDTLRDQVNTKELSVKTASDYISALNDVVKYVNENLNRNLETISAKAVDLSKGSIQYQDRTVSQEVHQEFKEYLSQQNDIRSQALSYSVDLQRSCGLRLEGSIAIKKETIQQALRTGELQLSKEDGTKNSQPRTIPITTQEQRQALQNALEFMRSNELKSLAPTEKLRQQYYYAQNIRTKFNLQKENQMDFHGERHYFAQSMLQQGYSKQETSEALGHHREEILRHYIPM